MVLEAPTALILRQFLAQSHSIIVNELRFLMPLYLKTSSWSYLTPSAVLVNAAKFQFSTLPQLKQSGQPSSHQI